MSDETYSPGEEKANRVTHGLGVLLSAAGLAAMVVAAAVRGDSWYVTSSAIYGTTLLLLYTASTVYHSTASPRWRPVCRRIDHAAIFLLIAGTYTPFVLGPLRGAWGWSLFGVIWGLALAGATMKFWFAGRFRVLSTAIYLVMGWLIVVAAKPLMAALPAGGLIWLLAGGACYTAGSGFYLRKRMPYGHAVWHVWVLAGSACHWMAIFRYVIP